MALPNLPPEVYTWFNSFISYFQSQTTSVQVLLGILIILGCIAAGFIVYGILWIAYQAVKGIIVGMILLVYLIAIGIGLFFMLFIDNQEIDQQWQNATTNMKWFINKAYPAKNQVVIVQYPYDEKQIAIKSARRPSHVVIHLNSRSIHERDGTQEQATGIKRNKYCTTCGKSIIPKMKDLLNVNGICFCGNCGQKLGERNNFTAII